MSDCGKSEQGLRVVTSCPSYANGQDADPFLVKENCLRGKFIFLVTSIDRNLSPE